MNRWPKYPFIYEINTWPWLADLREQFHTPVDLSSVPAQVWDAIARFGFDAVWLMGVWERSPAGIDIANNNAALVSDFRAALPDFRIEDNVGSPYAVRQYEVDHHLGGPYGLAIARQELASRGMRLILDFVPNHVAPDHPWVQSHPEFFITATDDQIGDNRSGYLRIGGLNYACGRDPYFPPWPDVLQLNAFAPELRHEVIATLDDIASQCDGVRCDMAMLLLNSIFERTWKRPAPATEYWADVISAVRKSTSDFLFIAEAYWDLEWTLQQLGFDFCYDKRLYDRMIEGHAEPIRLHLGADMNYQNKLLRFIENHDEPRAATAFASSPERAAALAIATLPGARLFQEGQFEGRKIRPPVFLGRRPKEPIDMELRSFYEALLTSVRGPALREGTWSMCSCSGWPDNQSWRNLLAWVWELGSDRRLVVINFSGNTVQGRVQVPWQDLGGETWGLKDSLSSATYERDGDEMVGPGMYVELGPWGVNSFSVQPAHARQITAPKKSSASA